MYRIAGEARINYKNEKTTREKVKAPRERATRTSRVFINNDKNLLCGQKGKAHRAPHRKTFPMRRVGNNHSIPFYFGEANSRRKEDNILSSKNL